MIRTVKYWALAALMLLGACDKHDPKPVPIPTPVIKGADISWVTEMESRGFKFYNAGGQEREGHNFTLADLPVLRSSPCFFALKFEGPDGPALIRELRQTGAFHDVSLLVQEGTID